jgi:hypothetical protein
LLGQVIAEAAHRQLGVYQKRRTLPDGAVVVAEKFGAIPRITIVPPPVPSQPQRTTAPDAFVLWARSASLPDGIDVDHPQHLARPPRKDSGWRTYTFDSSSAAHRDGTYRDVLPGGVNHAGNLDWKGADGQRVSWYGPSNRILAEPYVFARSQYGSRLFYLGKALLDVEAYQTDSDPDGIEAFHWILGACLRRVDGVQYIYAIQTYLPTSVAVDPDVVPAGVAAASGPLQLASNNVFLVRYRLLFDPLVTAVADRWSVAINSREILAGWAIPRMVHPWRFNASGTKATAAGALAVDEHLCVFESDAGSYTFTEEPAASANRYDVAVDTAVLTTVPLAMAPGDWVPLIVDYDVDTDGGEVERALEVGRPTLDGKPVLALRTGGLVLPLTDYEIAADGATRDLWYVQTSLLHANVRDQVYCFLVTTTTGSITMGEAPSPDDLTTLRRIHIYRGSQRVADLPTHSPAAIAPTLNFDPFEFTTVGGGVDAVYPRGDFFNYRLAERPALSPLHAFYGVWVTGNILDWAADGTTWTFGYNVEFFGTLFGQAQWPATHVFGWYLRNNTGSDRPANLVSAGVLPGFDTSIVDRDGRPWTVGCATLDNATLYSGPGFSGGFDVDGVTPVGVTGEGTSFADGTTPALLTGVGGAQCRYHPIWVLGLPIKEDL